MGARWCPRRFRQSLSSQIYDEHYAAMPSVPCLSPLSEAQQSQFQALPGAEILDILFKIIYIEGLVAWRDASVTHNLGPRFNGRRTPIQAGFVKGLVPANVSLLLSYLRRCLVRIPNGKSIVFPLDVIVGKIKRPLRARFEAPGFGDWADAVDDGVEHAMNNDESTPCKPIRTLCESTRQFAPNLKTSQISGLPAMQSD
ncbi:hypothetical protein HWV62_30795 [Athelia sp. TMB]|nr:hypothetical protein HWV62_30795 [Athelia sp. TMB]